MDRTTIDQNVWQPLTEVDHSQYSDWFEFTDNKNVPEKWRGFKADLPRWWGIHIDFEKGQWTRNNTLGAGYPDLNELAARKILQYKTAYKEHRVQRSYDFRMTERSLTAILNNFKKHGFNVTREAVIHNYGCWRGDLKSGYRDDANGYHLFTPCGCNPFSLTATELATTPDVDWQTTYEW